MKSEMLRMRERLDALEGQRSNKKQKRMRGLGSLKGDELSHDETGPPVDQAVRQAIHKFCHQRGMSTRYWHGILAQWEMYVPVNIVLTSILPSLYERIQQDLPQVLSATDYEEFCLLDEGNKVRHLLSSMLRSMIMVRINYLRLYLTDHAHSVMGIAPLKVQLFISARGPCICPYYIYICMMIYIYIRCKYLVTYMATTIVASYLFNTLNAGL